MKTISIAGFCLAAGIALLVGTDTLALDQPEQQGQIILAQAGGGAGGGGTGG